MSVPGAGSMIGDGMTLEGEYSCSSERTVHHAHESCAAAPLATLGFDRNATLGNIRTASVRTDPTRASARSDYSIYQTL